MRANIWKSILLILLISVGASILSAIVSPLTSKSVDLAVGVDALICLGSLVAYVLLAKSWLTRQRSRFLDFLSVSIVLMLIGFALSGSSSPPYGTTLTLFNAYLAPVENITHHFDAPILNNNVMGVPELQVPLLLMWCGLMIKRKTLSSLWRSGMEN